MNFVAKVVAPAPEAPITTVVDRSLKPPSSSALSPKTPVRTLRTRVHRGEPYKHVLGRKSADGFKWREGPPRGTRRGPPPRARARGDHPFVRRGRRRGSTRGRGRRSRRTGPTARFLRCRAARPRTAPRWTPPSPRSGDGRIGRTDTTPPRRRRPWAPSPGAPRLRTAARP